MLRGYDGRVVQHVQALAAELAAYVSELPTAANNSPASPAPPAEEPRALSTGEAARLLGVTPYTLNEWARRGRIRCRQDSPGGRRYFNAADVAAYTAEHTSGGLPALLAGAYSAGDDNPPAHQDTPARAPHDTKATSKSPRGNPQYRRPVGARRTRRDPTRGGRPYAPGAHAWRPPQEPEG